MDDITSKIDSLEKKIIDILISFKEYSARHEERYNNFESKLERALKHAHDAQNIARSANVLNELFEKEVKNYSKKSELDIINNKLTIMGDEINDIRKVLNTNDLNKSSRNNRIIAGVYNSIITATIIGIAAIIWERIANK